MFMYLLRTVASWFGFGGEARQEAPREAPRGAVFTIQSFEDRGAATVAAQRDGIAALVHSNGRYKWLLLKCPCGCGRQIALNLMQSHSPHWRLNMQSATRFTVHPSVDATSCGAHFWLRDGRVIWCA